MTDRELLEAAARAAGIELDWDVPPKSPPWRISGKGEDRGPAAQWNPLTDDGDALRLAVKLEMGVIQWKEDASATHGPTGIECMELFGSDHYAATRRAIVRAAAAIGTHKEGA